MLVCGGTYPGAGQRRRQGGTDALYDVIRHSTGPTLPRRQELRGGARQDREESVADTPPAEWIALDQIRQHPQNMRRHLTRAQVQESIEAHDQYRPMVVQKATGYVLAGNGLLSALHDQGRTHGWVWWVDVDDEEALEILLVDNATSDGSTWEDDKLAAILDRMRARSRGLYGTGFTPADADDLLQLVGEAKTAQELIDQHGTEVADDTFWPVLRFKVPQKVMERWERLAAATRKGEPHEQLQRILGWAEKGRPKKKRT